MTTEKSPAELVNDKALEFAKQAESYNRDYINCANAQNYEDARLALTLRDTYLYISTMLKDLRDTLAETV